MENLNLATFEFVLDQIPLHIVITDTEGVITYANKGVEKITGYTSEEALGKKSNLWGGMMDKDFYMDMWKIIKVDKQEFSGIIKNKKKSGQIYYASLKISPIIRDNQLIGFCGVEQDMSNIQSISDLFDLTLKRQEILEREINALESKLNT